MDKLPMVVIPVPYPDEPELQRIKTPCPQCSRILHFPAFATYEGKIRIDEKRWAFQLVSEPECRAGHITPISEYIKYIKTEQRFKLTQLYDPLIHKPYSRVSSPSKKLRRSRRKPRRVRKSASTSGSGSAISL